MENFIYIHCGAQFSQTAEPPPRCPICQDERQFVRHEGQQWTTLQELARHHRNRIEDRAPRLLGIGMEPEFAIAQRALLVQSPAGNLLWDCISLLDDNTITEVRTGGGIPRDRDLASALLLLNGRMGGPFRRGDIFTRRGSPVGHARQSAHSVLGRHNLSALG